MGSLPKRKLVKYIKYLFLKRKELFTGTVPANKDYVTGTVTTNNTNSASADGGPRSRVRARGTLRSAPIGTSRIFPAHVSAE